MSDPYGPPPAPQPQPPALPVVRPIPTGTPLKTDTNIQGNVLAAFNKDWQTFLLLQWPNADQARAWLTALLPRLSNNASVAAFNADFSAKRHAGGGDPEDLAALWVNVSITGAALAMLAPDASTALNALPVDPGVNHFTAGAPNDAAAVGDVGPAIP